ncbi:hypothetical protein Bca52824_026480 [Brassica carinata]|uniref:Uncharacterized protein n=1 Tax=Brassica carinata TaxID=52824 RepID=A0A8X7SIN5_BRACI|nr:hypothetical protein Bca52824_026480 [Brassica carinata]
MKQGDSSVREYNSSFLAVGLLDNHDQRMLVKMYRDGLKEDIWVALGSTEFSTIDDIMQAALDIKEGDRSSSSDSLNESDDSEKRPKKKPRTKMQPEDGHSGEEPYGDKDTSKMKQGDSSVREYNASFAAAGLTNNPDQGMLLKMYRDGLKKDIRVALGSTEFSTIEDIMQAAIEIEEGPRSSSSDSSNESDGSDSSNESDESEKRQKKNPQTEFEPEDEQPDEDPYGDKDETDDGEGSNPNTSNESESESDSAEDLRDYQEYLQNNHLSCSESSEESD